MRFRIEPEASAELHEAALWSRRSGLGDEFLDAVNTALELIARFPQAGGTVPDVALDVPVRRIPVRRFPLHIVYLELPDVIRVLAFAHDRRPPEYWRSRALK